MVAVSAMSGRVYFQLHLSVTRTPLCTIRITAMAAPDLVLLFQALADRTRLRLLHLLAGGELCVCYFVEILGEAQPKISRHLAYLRRSGLVAARRDGKWMHYRLVRPADVRQAEIVDSVLAAIAGERQMQRDKLALEKACCALVLPPALRDAPRPEIASGPRARA
jgi:ArsR family transcriptional regulator